MQARHEEKKIWCDYSQTRTHALTHAYTERRVRQKHSVKILVEPQASPNEEHVCIDETRRYRKRIKAAARRTRARTHARTHAHTHHTVRFATYKKAEKAEHKEVALPSAFRSVWRMGPAYGASVCPATSLNTSDHTHTHTRTASLAIDVGWRGDSAHATHKPIPAVALTADTLCSVKWAAKLRGVA
jgi:hypothetical protein